MYSTTFTNLIKTETLETVVKHLDDAVLIDVLEDVRRIHQYTDRAGRGDDEENVKLQPIDHHRDVLPILPSSLRRCSAMNSTASVALLASGDSKIESELSLSRRQLSAPMPRSPLFSFRFILQFGWCRSDSSITSIFDCFAPSALMCFGISAGDPYDGWVCGCGGTLMPGISIIQRRRVLRGRFISSIAGR
uniref:Uncharacterized protein n=1 Tax=Anopheles merus TaxID=30066 RepID=A0A182VJV6_ANOME